MVQESLQKKEAQYRSVSQTSNMLCMSVDSIILDIMEEKVALLSAERDYLKTYRNGIIDLHAIDSEIKDELLKDIRASRKQMRSLESELTVLKRQKKIIQDGLNESIPDCTRYICICAAKSCPPVANKRAGDLTRSSSTKMLANTTRLRDVKAGRSSNSAMFSSNGDRRNW
jgi:hypothetical protein